MRLFPELTFSILPEIPLGVSSNVKSAELYEPQKGDTTPPRDGAFQNRFDAAEWRFEARSDR